MCQSNDNKPILIRDEGGIRTFRDPDSGAEYSVSVSKPIVGMKEDDRSATLKCMIVPGADFTKQLIELRSVLSPDISVGSPQLLAQARAHGLVTLAGLTIWKAEQILKRLTARGFIVQISFEA